MPQRTFVLKYARAVRVKLQHDAKGISGGHVGAAAKEDFGGTLLGKGIQQLEVRG